MNLPSSVLKELDGIRYLKKPVKVDYVPWGLYTMDCASLISDLSDTKFFMFLHFQYQRKLLIV